MSLLERMQRVIPNAGKLSASRTFQLLRDLDVQVWPDGENGLGLDGPSDAVSYLAPALLKHKAALRAGACRCCASDLAERDGLCRYCSPMRDRRVAYDPGSEAEQRFLRALAQRPPNAVQLAA